VKARFSVEKPNPGHPFFLARGIDLQERPSVIALLRRPEIRLEELLEEKVIDDVEILRREDIVSLETAVKYEGYLRQQEREVEKLRRAESRRIPENLDYGSMPGLSREIVEKLSRIRPKSIAQASRIPGITPASISILLFHIEIMRHANPPESVA
jgi:tRNA uridine 5-carboxymethylaminomethyl modification enzyme